MLSYQIYQCKLKDTPAFGKWYARVVTDETVGVDGLAMHMHSHNTPFSQGMIKGILNDAIKCTKELLLEGKRVQWDNLASFGITIEHKMGADSADAFSVNGNVKGIKMSAQGIGTFNRNVLSSAARLGENKTYVSPKTPANGKSYVSLTIEGEGTVMIDGKEVASGTTLSYPYGSKINLEAVPNENWMFVKWEDGSLEATRELTLSETSVAVKATFNFDESVGPDII